MRGPRNVPNERTGKTTARDIRKMNINNMPDREFKVAIIKILHVLKNGGHQGGP